jgi:hypothetical protein
LSRKNIDPINITKDAFGFPINGLEEYDDDGAWVTPYVIHPTAHPILYLGVENVWISVDQGKNWGRLSNFVNDFNLPEDTAKIYSLAVGLSPSDNLYIYASTYSEISNDNWGASNILACSKDEGWTWSNITPVPDLLVTYIAVKDNDPETVWVTLGGFNSHGVYRSRNAGTSWENISEGLPPIPVYCIVQNKKNIFDEELYVGTYQGVYRKIGKSEWEPYNAGLPNVRVNELEIYYSGSSGWGTFRKEFLYAATFGRGMWRSELEDVDIRFWTGIESSDWYNENNWSPKKVPTSSTDVYIPDRCPNYPIIQNLYINTSCKNLRLYKNSQLTSTTTLSIGEESKLICDSLSTLYIGGAWINNNTIEQINEGYGFISESTSQVIFINQTTSVLSSASGSETFQNLHIQKTSNTTLFIPSNKVIVKELCNIGRGRWEDNTDLIHEFYGDFFVEPEGVLHMSSGSRLDFLSNGIQSIKYNSEDINTNIASIKVKGPVVKQLTNLSGISAINGNLTVENGTYEVVSRTTQVYGNISIVFAGIMSLNKTKLMINNLIVLPGGLFSSTGYGSVKTQVTKVSTTDYTFTVYGQIQSISTNFVGMNINGINIAAQGSILNIDTCTFSSTDPNCALLKIDNNQSITLNSIEFSFIPSQKTVSKSVNLGIVAVNGYSPINSKDFEFDPFNRIHWESKTPEEVITKKISLVNLDEIKIFPNPSSGIFVIENDHISEGVMYFRITDLTGQTIYSGDLHQGKNSLQAGTIAKGVYLLKIDIDQQQLVRKIVIN